MPTENDQISAQIEAQRILTLADNNMEFPLPRKPSKAKHVPVGADLTVDRLITVAQEPLAQDRPNKLAATMQEARGRYARDEYLKLFPLVQTAEATEKPESEEPEKSEAKETLATGPTQEETGLGFNKLESTYPAEAKAEAMSAIQTEALKAQQQEEDVAEPVTIDMGAMAQNFNTSLEDGPESIKNTGTAGAPQLMQLVEEGDKLKEIQSELQKYAKGEESYLTKAFRILDYIFAPTMAPLAAMEAPLANPAETGSFIGDLLANAATAGRAANERLLRWLNPDGDFMPDYSTKIVERYLPGIPEQYRETAGVTLELLATLPVSFGMASAMQKAIAKTNILERTADFPGLLKEAVYQFLGWSPAERVVSESTKNLLAQIEGAGTNREKIQELLRDAELAESGDRQAFVRLSEAMSGQPGKNIVGTEEALAVIDQVVGKMDSPSYTITQARTPEGAIDQASLQKTLEDQVALSNVRFNLTNITDGAIFDQTFDEAVETLKARFSETLKDAGQTVELVPKDQAKWPEMLKLWERYDDVGDIVTESELADELESLITEGLAPKHLQREINDLRDAIEDDFVNWGGRGDISEEVDNLIVAFQEAMEERLTGSVNVPAIDPKAGFISKKNAETLRLARESQKALEDLYGVPIERMTLEETMALRVITVDSMKQLLEYRAIMNNPEVAEATRLIATAAFSKQLMIHHLIQAKVTGSYSIAGQLLQSANIVVCE